MARFHKNGKQCLASLLVMCCDALKCYSWNLDPTGAGWVKLGHRFPKPGVGKACGWGG